MDKEIKYFIQKNKINLSEVEARLFDLNKNLPNAKIEFDITTYRELGILRIIINRNKYYFLNCKFDNFRLYFQFK